MMEGDPRGSRRSPLLPAWTVSRTLRLGRFSGESVRAGTVPLCGVQERHSGFHVEGKPKPKLPAQWRQAPVPSPASVSPSGKWEFSTCGHLHILIQWNSVYIQSSPPGITFCLQDFTFTPMCNGILLLWSGTPLSINKRLLLNGTQRTVKRWPPTYHVCK